MAQLEEAERMNRKRVLICITGASGAVYGVRLLRAVKSIGHETHLIVSKWGGTTLEHETGIRVASLLKEADHVYDEDDLAAGPSSGSFPLDAVAIVPCSMKTLAAVAHGYADNLIVRAADCALKERRRLILVPREAPYNSIHIRNMLIASRAGAMIFPASPPFWSRPSTIEQLVDGVVDRLLVHLGLADKPSIAWKEES